MDAAEIMTRPVITAGPDDTVNSIAARFSKHGICAVPVCDKDGSLLGVIQGQPDASVRPKQQTAA